MDRSEYTATDCEKALRNVVWLIWNGLPETKRILGIGDDKRIRIDIGVSDDAYVEYSVLALDAKGFETVINRCAFPVNRSGWDGQQGWKIEPLYAGSWEEYE